MAEFDLIPGDYRSGLARRRWLQIFLAALAAMVVLTGGAAAALDYAAREVDSEIDAEPDAEHAEGHHPVRLRSQRRSAYLYRREPARGG